MAIYSKSSHTIQFRWCLVALMMLTHLCCVAAGEQSRATGMPAGLEAPLNGNLLIANNDGLGTEM